MRNVLTLREQLFLTDRMKESYAESKLDDGKYAEYINEKHSSSFRQPIGRVHIFNMRQALDMPPNCSRGAKQMDAGECLGLIARVQALEERVEKLAATVKGLMK